MFRVELMPAIAETHVCFSESNHRPNKTAACYACYIAGSSCFCVTDRDGNWLGNITAAPLTTARQMTTYGHDHYHSTNKFPLIVGHSCGREVAQPTDHVITTSFFKRKELIHG